MKRTIGREPSDIWKSARLSDRRPEKRDKLIYRIYPPCANFIFFEGVPGLDRLLAGKGFAIRSCENYRQLGPGDYRIAVRTGEENEALLQALDELAKEL